MAGSFQVRKHILSREEGYFFLFSLNELGEKLENLLNL